MQFAGQHVMTGTGSTSEISLLVLVCRQLSIHRSSWGLRKVICDTRKSWMQSKWTDLQTAAAAQQLQQVEEKYEEFFAEDTPEVRITVLALCMHALMPT